MIYSAHFLPNAGVGKIYTKMKLQIYFLCYSYKLYWGGVNWGYVLFKAYIPSFFRSHCKPEMKPFKNEIPNLKTFFKSISIFRILKRELLFS